MSLVDWLDDDKLQLWNDDVSRTIAGLRGEMIIDECNDGCHRFIIDEDGVEVTLTMPHHDDDGMLRWMIEVFPATCPGV